LRIASGPTRSNMSYQEMSEKRRKRIALAAVILCALLAAPLFSVRAAAQEDWIRTGTGLGVERVRLAVPEFQPLSATPQVGSLSNVFNQTLWNDLEYAGLFDMVSRSFYPLQAPGHPDQVTADPAEITRAERALARRIRDARKKAKRGDIFTPAISMSRVR